jgi:prepilin-type N-terminal cleavage/methylation domain-containing protein
MKRNLIRLDNGFTLIELTIAIMIGLAISTMVLVLFNQQLAFLRIYRAQSFLTEEAPVISVYVSRIIGKSDRFRLHDNLADALANVRSRTTPSPVVVLNFRQPDGTMRASILSFEDRGGGPALYYYVVPITGSLGAPQWAITKRPTNVSFSMNQGVLQMALTGPAGELITYSGTMQQ